MLERLDSRKDTPVEILLLRDFNLHHPSWGGQNALADPEAAALLELVDRFGLKCITPQGIVTFSRRHREYTATSTIDLAFASPAAV